MTLTAHADAGVDGAGDPVHSLTPRPIRFPQAMYDAPEEAAASSRLRPDFNRPG